MADMPKVWILSREAFIYFTDFLDVCDNWLKQREFALDWFDFIDFLPVDRFRECWLMLRPAKGFLLALS